MLKARDSFTIGKKGLLTNFKDIIHNDRSFERIIQTDLRPQNSVPTTGASEILFRVHQQKNRFFLPQYSNLYFTVRYETEAAAKIDNDAVFNLPPTFGLIDNSKWEVNGSVICHQYNLPEIMHFEKLISKTRDVLDKDVLNTIDLSDSKNNSLDIILNDTTASTSVGSVIVEVGSDAGASNNGKYIQFDQGATTVTNDLASDLKFYIRKRQDRLFTSYDANNACKTATARRNLLIENGGFLYVTYKIPVKDMFPCFQNFKRYDFMPFENMDITLYRRSASNKQGYEFVASASTYNCVLTDVRMSISSAILADEAYEEFKEEMKTKEIFTYPFVHNTIYTESVTTQNHTTSRSINNPLYICSWFRSTDTYDKYNMRTPTLFDTGTYANNTAVTTNHKIDGKLMCTSTDLQRKYDASVGNYIHAYEEYQNMALNFGNYDSLAVQYHNFRWNPFLCEKVDEKMIDGDMNLDIPAKSPTIDLEYQLSKAPSANTQIVILIKKMAWFTINNKTSVVESFNGK